MSAATPTIEELFDPEFVESVTRLKILARRVAAKGNPAEKRSRQQGSGMEFRDFRPYTPGDDFRSIDWNVYQRLGRVFLRLFEEQRDLPVYLAPDLSQSMFQGENPRAHTALRTAFALAAIAQQEHDSVGVFSFSNDLVTDLRPGSGKGRLLRIAQTLSRLQPGGETNFSKSMTNLRALNLRKGLLVIISDFFEPQGIESICEALKVMPHRMLLVQLVRKSDAEPNLSGDLLLKDCETGREHNVSATAAVIDAYKKAWSDFQARLNELARDRQAGKIEIDVDEDLVSQLARLFESGAYVL